MKKSLLVISALIISTNASNAQTPLTTAVDFTVTTMDGDEVNLFGLLNDGKYVVVDFFAYWCGVCAQNAPKFEESFEQFGCNSGDVYYISIEGEGTTEQTHTFETDAGLQGIIPTISGLDGGGAAVRSAYGISYFPTFILIAPDRQIVDQDIWPFSAITLRALLEENGLSPKSCESSTGILDITSNAAIAVAYPNPATNEVNIQFSLTAGTVVAVQIYDVVGKLVSELNSKSFGTGTNVVSIPTSSLANGNYMVRLSSNNGVFANSRFSISR